jgi:ABC-type multidrug transport system permease subunit
VRRDTRNLSDDSGCVRVAVPMFITPMILFSGMLYERNSVPNGLAWLQDLSIVNYGFATLIITECRYLTACGASAEYMSMRIEDHAVIPPLVRSA